MKLLKFLLLFLYSNCLFSQIEKRNGDVNVQVTSYSYKIDSLDESGLKREIAFDEFYFDNHGKLLEIIKHDFKSSGEIKAIVEIEQFIYNGQKILKSEKWIFNSKNNKTNFGFTEYDYDKKDSLVSKSFYQTNHDTLWFSQEYHRTKNKMEIRSSIPEYYQLIYYNDEGRIIKEDRHSSSGNQIWTYNYSGNCRTQRGDNLTLIVCYNPDNSIQTKEVIYSNWRKLYKYNYYKNGFLKEVIISGIDSKGSSEKLSSSEFQHSRFEKSNSLSIEKINQSLVENIE